MLYIKSPTLNWLLLVFSGLMSVVSILVVYFSVQGGVFGDLNLVVKIITLVLILFPCLTFWITLSHLKLLNTKNIDFEETFK